MNTTNRLPTAGSESREDVIVWALIAFVGALGVAIGILAPGRTVEPSLGIAMLFFVAHTFGSERRRLKAGEPAPGAPMLPRGRRVPRIARTSNARL